MDDAKRRQIRRRIEEAIAELQAQINGLEDNAKPVSLNEPIGRLSRMDAIANQALSGRVLAEAKTRLSRLQRALVAVDSPDFGLCDECGEEIPLPRLLAMPEARLCVDCAE